MLAHEKLKVYEKGLGFVASASAFSAVWDKRHAVVDQLDRASESLILNLADGARLRTAPTKLRSLDYALGSALECAGCLDVAQIKGLLGAPDARGEKTRLCEIVRMLIGLRKAWENWTAQEDCIPYNAVPATSPTERFFNHEELDVYQAALELVSWSVSLSSEERLPVRLWRQADESITSIVLNIAEGNGRYSGIDHRRFLDIAEGSAIRTAAYLDLAVQKFTVSVQECGPGKALLERIVAMLSRM